MAKDRADGTRSRLVGSLLAVGLAASFVLASPALAQEQPGDPYGATTTTDPAPSASPVCVVDRTEIAPGDTVTVGLSDVPPAQEVILLLGGVEVARGVAPEASGPTSMDLSFVVPELPGGRYRLDAVGATFTVGCGADGFVTVLGATVLAADPGAPPRTDPVAGPGAGAGSGGLTGALPRTGISIALLLAVALALLVAGRTLVDRARRRRRRHRRRPPARLPELARR